MFRAILTTPILTSVLATSLLWMSAGFAPAQDQPDPSAGSGAPSAPASPAAASRNIDARSTRSLLLDDERVRSTVRSLTHVLIPQSGAIPLISGDDVRIRSVEVDLDINGTTATTNLKLRIQNSGTAVANGTVAIPMQNDVRLNEASVDGVAAGKNVVSQKDSSWQLVKLAMTANDPRPLTYSANGLVCSQVLSLGGNATKTVIIQYEQTLSAVNGRVDYVFPRSDAMNFGVPWTLAARIHCEQPLSTVYSPSHQIKVVRKSTNEITATLDNQSSIDPGSFRLSYLPQTQELSATMFACPNPDNQGGHFLFLVGLPADVKDRKSSIKREVTLVIDRSSSMHGEKMQQVRDASKQIIEELDAGESFNTIGYNDRTALFAKSPVDNTLTNRKASVDFVNNLRPQGGTNYQAALEDALEQDATKGSLRIVLFLTDGLPTVGLTSEKALRELVATKNPHRRRVYTFGVGSDINTALLEGLSRETGATANFVLPKENVSKKMADFVRTLRIPVVADMRLEILDAAGKPATDQVIDVLPSRLPDLFAEDYLVLLGKYRGVQPVTFQLTGNLLGEERQFRFPMSFASASAENSFVPRLWASRQIASLVDNIRDLGADADMLFDRAGADPKLGKLVDEILQLTAEYGIVTEYTAFLATSPKPGTYRSALARALTNFDQQAYANRMGLSAISQSINLSRQRNQRQLNPTNQYLDSNLKQVQLRNVQQLQNGALFYRNGQWVDGRVLQAGQSKPPKVVKYGSPEFLRLLERLVTERRQGALAVRGQVVLEVDNQNVVVESPKASEAAKVRTN